MGGSGTSFIMSVQKRASHPSVCRGDGALFPLLRVIPTPAMFCHLSASQRPEMRRPPSPWLLSVVLGVLVSLMPITTGAAAQCDESRTSAVTRSVSPQSVSQNASQAGAPSFGGETCAFRTGVNATLILPDSVRITVRGATLQPGDQLAVFSPSGRCAGVLTWTGEAAALTVWGDNEQTPAIVEGMTAGDPFHFRVRRTTTGGHADTNRRADAPDAMGDNQHPAPALADSQGNPATPAPDPQPTRLNAPASVVLSDDRPYLTTTPVFQPDGIYILRDLHINGAQGAVAHEQ